VSSTLPIGDFSRATHLSVRMLRYYHEVGLLEPIDVDADTGCRLYATEQIVTAQVIRRFCDRDMPLDDIHAVFEATDVETRNRVISKHLARLESNLARTQQAARSLRDLWGGPQANPAIQHRYIADTSAALITDIVDKRNALNWSHGAMGELAATLTAQDIAPIGPAGGVYESELFTEDRGRATIFYPCHSSPWPVGRVTIAVIPSAELATITHTGSHADCDRSYGALGAYVTQHALAVEGPIREYYLVGPAETPDESFWRTDIGWPIFETRPPQN
jgi:DNA-binding transcriptional MerR regulator/effector-binding domain-containing protein